MNKYMVFLHGDKPEIIEAESFKIESPGILELWTGDGLTAAFYSWIGIKQLVEKANISLATSTTAPAATWTTTTTNYAPPTPKSKVARRA